MVPTTWVALLVLAVAVLPAAMFTFGFERQAGAFGVTLADRVLRFVAVSLFFDLLYAPAAYLIHHGGLAPPPWDAPRFLTVWLGALAAAALPLVAGSAIGGLYATRGSRTGWRPVRRLLTARREAQLLDFALGRDPAPRAWDHYFSERRPAYLRIRSHDGTWVGGLFADRSFAGSFPHDGDVLIEQAWPIDAAGVFGDEPLDYAVYVPSATISFVEILDLAVEGDA